MQRGSQPYWRGKNRGGGVKLKTKRLERILWGKGNSNQEVGPGHKHNKIRENFKRHTLNTLNLQLTTMGPLLKNNQETDWKNKGSKQLIG